MYRSFRVLVAIVTLGVIASFPIHGANAQGSDAASKPNFVIIMADDLGYGDLSCYDGWIKTPHLDKLAASGMRFTDFHSNGSVCSPTRAALLTGRYQQRAGIPGVVFAAEDRPEHEHGLQAIENTFAEMLAKNGYTTAAFGKWHLGYYPKYNPVNHGFGEFRGYVSGNVDFFSHVDQAGNYDWWNGTNQIEEPGYVTELITKHAVAFIDQNHDRPFCLYLPHEAPHYPYQGPDDKPLRKVGQARTAGELKMSQAEKKRAYREMVESMDAGIGRVDAELARHDLLENTLVFFCSDNGATALGSNGELRGNKGQVWEGGHRVPAIASWPGKIKPGTTNAMTCMTFDLMPTMLDYAGIEPDADRPLDGVSLRSLFAYGDRSADERFQRMLVWNGQAIRKSNWKLVSNGRTPAAAQLFDLTNDLGEKDNVAAKNPEMVRVLNAKLREWQADVKATATPQP